MRKLARTVKKNASGRVSTSARSVRVASTRRAASSTSKEPRSSKNIIQRKVASVYSPNIIKNKTGSVVRTANLTMGFNTSGSGGNAKSVAQSPLYYDYRWSTPDKFYFPRNRVVANSIWREIYKRDACVATVTDMYAEMPWSQFDLVGIDDASIRKVYEDMFTTLNLLPVLPNYTRDFLVTGEQVLHAVFDSTKGFWNRIISHNPDYIRAEGIGLIAEQPLLYLSPTPEIRRLINSPDPRVRKLQGLLPRELVNAFRMNRAVPLDPLNTTFLGRLNSSQDVRGTSLYTRLFRVVMYEDFIMNASLAIAQRNAAPLRIFKLGDPKTDWLPSEEDEQALAEMLSMAEADPLAAIIMHKDISVELVGVSDRVLLISKEWDFIERVKLLAMGVSKGFLVGEASFAASVAGLQTLMERLSSLRAKFENQWILKKLCQPVAEMNEFYKRPQCELDHKIRVQRSEEQQPLVPTLKWRKSLEATQDAAILNIWNGLAERGILSERTHAAGAGLDLEVERKNREEEATYKAEKQLELQKKMKKESPEEANADAAAAGGEQPPPPKVPQIPGVTTETSFDRDVHRTTKEILKKVSSYLPETLYSEIEAELEDAASKKFSTDGSSVIKLEDALDATKDVLENKGKLLAKLDAARAELHLSDSPAVLSGE